MDSGIFMTFYVGLDMTDLNVFSKAYLSAMRRSC